MLKKYLFTFFVFVILGLTLFCRAGSPERDAERESHFSVETYIQNVYHHLDFGKEAMLSYQAFRDGLYGYLTLQEAGKLSADALLTICDFSLSSNLKRLWVIDLLHQKICFHTLVAHGMRSGEEFALSFSNRASSHQSSLGFYVTGEIYQGAHGASLKLIGLDSSFNDKASERSIVMHGAPYVSEAFASSNHYLGRSHGCPAIPDDIAPSLISCIQGGQCLFIYYPLAAYESQSMWLTKPILHLAYWAGNRNLRTKLISADR